MTPSNQNKSVSHPILIYNRVPKCGSTTMQRIIHELKKLNKFHYEVSEIYNEKALSYQEADTLLKSEILPQVKNGGFVFDRHAYFFSETEHGIYPRKINWINVVRKPLERMISNFHYIRHPKRWIDAKDLPSNVSTFQCYQEIF